MFANYFQQSICSRSCFLPLVPLVAQVAQIEKWLYLGCIKLLILRNKFKGITLSKPHLVCTFYNKQINAKKYEWKFRSVQILMARQCVFNT